MRMKRNRQFFWPFLALIFNSPDPDGPNTTGGWHKVWKQIKVKLTQIGLPKGVPLRPKMRINVNWHFQSARIRNASAYAHYLHETHFDATAWPSLVYIVRIKNCLICPTATFKSYMNVLYVVLYECPICSVSEYMFATEQMQSDHINLIQMFVYSVILPCVKYMFAKETHT